MVFYIRYSHHPSDFCHVEPSLHSHNKSNLALVYNHFIVLLDQVCWDFVEDFCFYIHKGYWSVTFFSCDLSLWLPYQGNAGNFKGVKKFFFLSYFFFFFFFQSLRRIGVNSSLNILQNSPVKSSGPGLYFVGWFCFVSFFGLFVFLGPHPRHMEVPRPGVSSEFQPPAYTTATATQDLSRFCDLHHSSQQCRIPNLLSKARDRTCVLMDASRVC